MMEPSEQPSQPTKPLVLLAENSSPEGGLSRDALLEGGFAVEEAADGFDVVARFGSLRPDLVLLDADMPKLDGPSICREIRTLPEGQRTPVLVMTGCADVDTIGQAYQAGATDFITKPINDGLLKQRLQYALRTSQAMNTLEQTRAETQALLDAIPDLILETDSSGRVLDYRPARGSASREMARQLVNQELSQVFPGSVSTEYLHFVGKTLETGEPQSFDYRMSMQGSLHEYEARTVPRSGGRVLALVRDVTERGQEIQGLRRERDFVSSILDAEPALVMVLDRRGCIVRFNQACQHTTGYTFEEVARKVPWNIFPRSDGRDWDKEMFQAALAGRTVNDYEGHLLTKEGEDRLVVWSHSTIVDHEGRVEYVIRSGGDLTDRKQAEERMRFRAHYDELTGLPSRSMFMENLSRALAASSRHHRLVAVLFLGLERLPEGGQSDQADLLTKAIGERLRNFIRKSDYVAHQTPEGELGALSRFGDNEFTIFLTDLRDPDGAAKAAERLLEAISAAYDLEGNTIQVRASVGISVYPHDGGTEDAMLANAEMAMQGARQTQGNAYRFYSQSMNASSGKKTVVEEELSKALEQEEFFLLLQPKFSASGGEIAGLESLIRWNHPSRGVVPPAEFISIAEETGQVVPMGNWILGAACRQAVLWQKTGLPALPLSVNLSSVQFWREGLCSDIQAALEQSALDPSYLELEISERTLMENGGEIEPVLRRIKELGVKIAVDDFGTGFSSLGYLKDCPIDTLKLDRSFVANLPDDALDSAIATTTINMAHTLGLTVVAEGVETKEQLEFLKTEGCDQVQGYLFSPPVSADEAEKFLVPEPVLAGV